jgi:hypothetical protein
MANTDKAMRRLNKVVDEAIRKHGNASYDKDATPVSKEIAQRWDAAFDHLNRQGNRHDRRRGRQ